jgi:methylated-DNA-[protein]-cysteine S-methyltransferase
MQAFLSRLESPLGDMLLVTDERQQLRALDFVDHKAHLYRGLREHYGRTELIEVPAPDEVVQSVARYFAGEINALTALRTASAGSDLQRQVWAALRLIPASTTTTYGKLAKELGFDDPRAAIDMGAAIGANPIAVVVPCHRVIASNGDLKGYAWGLHRKRWLLEHENAIPREARVARTPRLRGF